MIWLTWRQHRMQVLVGAAVLAAIASFLLLTGFGIASSFRTTGLAGCLATPGRDCTLVSALFNKRFSGLQFTIPLFLVLPALIGVFWGAPLVAREVEQGTHRLAWTQGVTRLRWINTKVAAMGAATLAGAAALAWLTSWWSLPFVRASDDRFSRGVFDLRGVVPVGYALFALAVGVAVGTLVRRTVPAMAATLGSYAVVRGVVEFWIRPHFAGPRTVSYGFFGSNPRSGLGDWVLSTRTVDGAGHVLARGQVLDINLLSHRCPSIVLKGEFPFNQTAVQACIRRIGLHLEATYQPGNRYWTFQGIEAAVFVALSVGLLALSVWWVRRRVA
ncbi:MAG TPA: ABC transporter permease subunit [Actinomycetota bacterium]